MRKPELKEFYDVAIIGSGISGMTAAALLSKAGYSVCVLEMDSRVGGYVAGFRRKDFRFDTAIHWLNQCGPGGLVHNVFSFIGSDFPKPKQQTVIRRMKSDSFNYLLTTNPDELKEQWIKEFPHEKKGIEKFFRHAKKVGRSFKILGFAFRSMESMRPLEKASYGLRMLKFALPFIKHLGFTGEEGVKKGLNRYFKDQRLHDIFCSENDVLSCLVPVGWAYYSDYQMPPEGGSQVFPEWLSHVVEYFDNDIFFKCRVKKVIVENGEAKGVELESRGIDYTVKSKYVIAACDVETLYEKMLPAGTITEDFKSKLKKAELYSSSVTISIALDCPTQDLGFGEELVFLSKEGITKKQHVDGNPHTSGISILAPSLRDSSMAPADMGTLTIYIAAEISDHNYWGAEKDAEGNYIRGDKYNETKESVAQVLIDRLEEQYPGFKKHILFYDVATPITHQRYTGNKNGSIMGARPGKQNMKSKIAHIQTPVKNLLLGSQWAELGGGVPIAVKAGTNAALMVMKYDNRPTAQSLAQYMDGKLSLENAKNAKGWLNYDNSWTQELTPADKKKAKNSSNTD